MIEIEAEGIQLVEFNLYREKNAEKFFQVIKNNQEKNRVFFNEILDFYLFTSFLLDTKKINFTENENALVFIYLRSMITFYGIEKLIENGTASEAFPLIRVLFELYVTLKILLEVKDNVSLRSELFLDFDWIIKKRKKEESPEIFNSRDSENIDTKFESIKNRYDIKKRYYSNFDWTWYLYKDSNYKKTNLFSICRRFGLVDDYNKIYALLSQFVHPSSIFTKVFLNNGKAIAGPNFNEYIFVVSIMASGYFIKTIDQILEFKEIKDELRSIFMKMYLEFYSKYNKFCPWNNGT
jgi:hypothetical protein